MDGAAKLNGLRERLDGTRFEGTKYQRRLTVGFFTDRVPLRNLASATYKCKTIASIPTNWFNLIVAYTVLSISLL
jgi:hypothetical protein